jgi:glucose-6-phosphate isomerase
MSPLALSSYFNPDTGEIIGASVVRRYLSDLKGYFADTAAYDFTLAKGNPLVYSVASIESANGEGDLHYGLGVIYPGKIGNEYYLTKGHLHAWRPAAEFYIGLRGEGGILLEDEQSGKGKMLLLTMNSAVYVPGYTAHRTMNTGTQPLVYLGIYPAKAGHDYSSIAKKNFSMLVVEQNGKPTLIKR